MKINEGFQQKEYVLPPAWDNNGELKSLLRRLLGEKSYAALDAEAKVLQHAIRTELREDLAQDDKNADPYVTQYNQWGRQVNKLHTSEGWRGIKAFFARNGLIADQYERHHGPSSRTYSMSKIYLITPDSRYVGCPFSMTDGCARVLELFGDQNMKETIFSRLKSRGSDFYTAGQWMTERPGGSDVSLTETTATPLKAQDSYKTGDWFTLNGFKWFSSATDSDVALALAKTSPKQISLFLIRLKNEDGSTNGIYIHRLKNKFGTKAVPTAELSLEGVKARLVGEMGRGVATIATVLNITRVYSANTSVSQLRRALDIAESWAKVRHIAGDEAKMLSGNALHTSVLAQGEVVHTALLHFVFNTSQLLGSSEYAPLSSDDANRLRLLTPVVKAFCADLVGHNIPYCMEALGGQGYMLENQIPTLIADSSVERIWEGTSSILSLDIIRVIIKSKGQAVVSYIKWANSILAQMTSAPGIVRESLDLFAQSAKEFVTRPNPDPRWPRSLLFLLGYTTSALYMIEHFTWLQKSDVSETPVLEYVLKEWTASPGYKEAVLETRKYLSLSKPDTEGLDLAQKLVYRSNL